MASLCGATLEAETYVTIQDLRSSKGVMSERLMQNDIFYIWKYLKKDAITLKIFDEKMLKDVDEIIKYRSLIHFGERHFKYIVNAHSLTHTEITKSGFDILMSKKQAQNLLNKTENILVEIMMNYAKSMISDFDIETMNKLYR